MYIRRFQVRNFLVHQDTSLVLHPLTVLVGPNNGGKSAFFDAILNFSMLSRGNISQAFGPYPFSFKATRYRGASKVGRIGFSADVSLAPDSSEYLNYEIDYAQQGLDAGVPSFLIFNEKVTLLPKNEVLFDRAHPDLYKISRFMSLENEKSLLASIRSSRLVSASKLEIDPLLLHFTGQITKFNKFRLDPAALAAASRIPDIESGPADPKVAPRIGYLGEDLAATLYYLFTTHSPVLDVIRQKAQHVEPAFKDFDFSSVGTDRIGFSVRYSDERDSVPAVRLSSGFLTYIGLITLVSTPNRPSVLMIEEPENGLTPQAQKAFYQSLRGLAFNGCPEDRSQVLISSHSPFVICEAWNGEDRDFVKQVKVVDGRARIKSLMELVAEHHVPLGKDESGKLTRLSLKNAEDIMSGRFS